MTTTLVLGLLVVGIVGLMRAVMPPPPPSPIVYIVAEPPVETPGGSFAFGIVLVSIVVLILNMF